MKTESHTTAHFLLLTFISDTDYRNILKLCRRPWWRGEEKITDDEVNEMNEGLIKNWNSIVRPEDAVVILGDLALGKFPDSLMLVKRLNGTKALIPGNHDRCWRGTLKDPLVETNKFVKAVDLYKSVGLHILPSSYTYNFDGVEVLASHFPYSGDSHDEDRYVAWRPPDKGLPLIHGHVHEKWRTNGRQFNVGVDVNNFTPVSKDEVVAWARGL